jgi:hydroxymethylpyrimidine/phosphomethylpyrimidine kinase
VQTALSIAGSDPTGGAGVQADLQVFSALGVHGAGVLTALTVQDSARVHQVLPVFPSVVLEQIRVLLRDIQPAALKLGMLASDDVARQVGFGLDALGDEVPVVIDPVLQASDGTLLLERRAWASLQTLIEGCALVTPNLQEAEQLSGGDTSSRKGIEAAGRYFVNELGARAALVKGGHREADADDLLAIREADGVRVEWLAADRIEGGPVHGTGCALSAAITAGLAKRQPLEDAVREARSFVAAALRRAQPVGSGARFLVHR